jgi:hypothetical protein
MPPYCIEWLDEAKADVRALDRSTAMRLFEGTLHFARTGSGDVNALHGDMAGASVSAWATTASCSHSNGTSCASSASAIALRPTAEQLGGPGRDPGLECTTM